MGKLQIVKEVIAYFSQNKRYWLLPVVLFLLILGGLVVLSSNAVVAPFIYTLF